jgi:hypothetical protein
MEAIIGIIAAALVVVCLLLSGSRGFSQTTAGPPGKTDKPPAATTAEKIKSLDREQVRDLLKKLVNTPAPKDLKSSFAMCYNTAPPPTRADYVCPKCGERTVYDAGDNVPPLERADRDTIPIVQWEIAACRRKMKGLQKVAGDAMSLDEAQFCRKCSPKVNAPKLVLHVKYKGEKPRDIENIESEDLRLLQDFLAGKSVTEDDAGCKSLLKDDLPRLQELLGVKLDEQKR